MRCELCTEERPEGRLLCQSCLEMVGRLIKIQADFPQLTRNIKPVKIVTIRKSISLPDFAVLSAVNQSQIKQLAKATSVTPE